MTAKRKLLSPIQLFLFLILISGFCFSFTSFATAAPAAAPAVSQNTKAQTPVLSKIAPKVRQLQNPIASATPQELIGKVAQTALGIIGSLTLLAFMFGGFMWLTSAGNQEKVKKGTQTMLYATIGLFVIFGSYAILNQILGIF
tara:strand:+ start:2383 stop:2811 length:429 start_codon:yes stop_codon:yes gene_type:complete